jgi:L-aspartate oxidase
MHTDVLVIGTGLAGLSYALQLSQRKPKTNILLISKRDLMEGNTKYAQGGIAVVSNFKSDSYAQHAQDTITAGNAENNPRVVNFVVREGPSRLEELIAWGANFDKEGKQLHLGKEGGHSANRIVHHKDQSGLHVLTTLIDKVRSLHNVTLLEKHSLVDLITDHHLGEQGGNRCYGAYVISKDDEKILKLTAQLTILSTGGAGQVYENTTNPSATTGDGLGAAYRAKVRIKNLHYVQFHPTALYPKINGATFLISEAVRGAGAYLRNEKGIRFMKQYDERMELAPRDIVSRSIYAEIQQQKHPFVFLDLSHLDSKTVRDQFPTILASCQQVGIDGCKEGIPVYPAAHYFCGGIDVDDYSQSSMAGLYAIRDCMARIDSHQTLCWKHWFLLLERHHIVSSLWTRTHSQTPFLKRYHSGMVQKTFPMRKMEAFKICENNCKR